MRFKRLRNRRTLALFVAIGVLKVDALVSQKIETALDVPGRCSQFFGGFHLESLYYYDTACRRLQS